MEARRGSVWRVANALWRPEEATLDVPLPQILIIATLLVVLYTFSSVAGFFVILSAPVGGTVFGPNLTWSWAFVVIPLVLTVVACLGKWILSAYPTWAVSLALGETRPFRAVLGLVVIAEIPRVLSRFFELGIVYLGRDHLRDVQDLRPAIGLDLVISDTAPVLDAVLRQVNMFEAGVVMILAAGIVSNFGVGYRRATIAAVALWGAVQAIPNRFPDGDQTTSLVSCPNGSWHMSGSLFDVNPSLPTQKSTWCK